jgi:hypothetical protein
MTRLLAAACVVLTFVGVLMLTKTQAADAPLFEEDAIYSVAWDCTPTYMAEAVSVALTGGKQAFNPCYAEALKIRSVRKDGWLAVQDMADGSEWMANPARMIAIREQVSSLRAGR